MQIYRYPEPPEWPQLLQRPATSFETLEGLIRPVLDAVRDRGDEAVQAYTREFDGIMMEDTAVSFEALEMAHRYISEDLRKAIQLARDNIATFHRAQVETPEAIETAPGVTCWRKSVPISSVGLYIPGGTAPLFSTTLMLGIPARIAGCKEIVLCTPPDATGHVHPAILYTARLLGIHKIFRIGGAQAIAAMAYGTETVPQVYKIFGPGNQYVTTAKQLINREGVAIDMPAGPTELAVVVDETAHPAFVAADLLSQAEHGTDSQVILISTDEAMVAAVEAEVERQLEALPRREIAVQALANSKIILVRDAKEAMALSNAYAPEHLILASDHAEMLAEHVTEAGSVFLGHYTPESAGDYASGTNHTLPTNGFARAYSGVSVDAFVKKITFQQLTTDGLRHIGPAVETMAAAEELEGHKRAVTLRLETLENDPSEDSLLADRIGVVHRQTNETDIRIRINLDGKGKADIQTGLGFFDHMLEQLARHSGCDLQVLVQGDLHIDEHHTIEDTAIALGEALLQALGDKRGIERYGFLLPMDDALVQVALDFSGRNWLVWEADFQREKIGDMPTEMFYHFFKSFSDASKSNLNIKAEGQNEHHMIEAIFKGLAKSIKQAVRRNPERMEIPSTKGTL